MASWKNNGVDPEVQFHREHKDIRGGRCGTLDSGESAPLVISGPRPTLFESPYSEINLAAPENRFIVSISFGHDEIHRAMIDSGAMLSMVPDDVVRDYEFKVSPDLATVIGFGGSNSLLSLGVVRVPVFLHGVNMRTVDLHVFPREYISGMVILGADFLHDNQLAVDVNQRRLSKTLFDGTRWDFYPGNTDQSCRTIWSNSPCFLKENITLKPGEQKAVPVGWDLPGRLGSCDSCIRVPESDLIIIDEVHKESYWEAYAGIAEANDIGTRVLVVNHGRKSETINAGEVIGSVSSVVDGRMVELSGEVNVLNVEKPCTDNCEKTHDISSVVLPSELSDQEQEQVRGLLELNKDIFGDSDNFGQLQVAPYNIELTDHTPIYQRPRRFPEVVNREIEKQCHELYLQDIIEPSTSAWSSPVVPVRKKDGSIRLCIDYRKLNAVTRADRFPIPNLNDAVFGLHGMRYFTALDLNRGYYQHPLSDQAKQFTAFSTPRAHWQFKRLSFGLKNAPAAFQRGMQQILSGFPWSRVVVYIDDVLIMSETFDRHTELVQKVLSTLGASGVTLNLAKCCWFQCGVDFLGHSVSRDGLAKPKGYLDEVENFPKPHDKTGLKQFLGLVNFQRKFIKNCSQIMDPLSKATGGKKSKQSILDWTPAMDQAFDDLKTAMKEDIILAFPDYSEGAEPLSLFTDASGTGVGACLAQIQKGNLRPIAYASLSFNDAQRNYSTLERELVAIRWAVKVFRAFLFGVDFVVHTDHQPLVHLHNMHIVNARLARTLQELSEFSFVIRYTPGRDNIAADSLSRLHPPQSQPTVASPRSLPVGLMATEVPGGGDSLVQSLREASERALVVCVVPSTMTDLRKVLTDELDRNRQSYGLTGNKTLTRELRRMSCDGQVMCVEAVLAFSHLFRCIVLVHYGTEFPIVHAAGSLGQLSGYPCIHIQCISGVHYNPVFADSSYVRPDVLNSHAGRCCRDTVAGDLATGRESIVAVSTRKHGWCEYHIWSQMLSLMVQVKGEPFCALFDTGAQLSCITQRVAVAAGATVNASVGGSIRGIGGTFGAVIGVSTVMVSMPDGSSISHQFAVVDSDAMEYCLIFGVDLIEKEQWELNFAKLECSYPGGSWRFPGSSKRIVQSSAMIVSVTELEPDSLELSNLSNLLKLEEIAEMQSHNPQLRQLRRHLFSGGIWPKSLSRFRRYESNFVFIDGLVMFRRVGGPVVPVVPFSCFVDITIVLHQKTGHPGRERLLALVLGQVWCTGASQVVADVTRSCEHCQRIKTASVEKPPVRKIRTTAPFELLAVDLLQLPKSRGGCVYCLVAIDHNSKWLTVVPITSKTTSVVASAMKHRVLPQLPRIPIRVLSDNGGEFASREFTSMLNEFGIRHSFSTPYKPSSNGLVERVNRTVLELLRSLNVEGGGWFDELAKAVILYNNGHHTELHMSPSAYLLSHQHNVTTEPVLPVGEVDLWRQGNPSFAPFRRGQLVLRQVIKQGRLVSNKLSERYDGLFEVILRHQNDVTYIIRDCKSGDTQRAHHTQLRRFYKPPSYIASHPTYRRLVLEHSPFDIVPGRGDISEDELPCSPDMIGVRVVFSDSVDTSTDIDTDSSVGLHSFLGDESDELCGMASSGSSIVVVAPGDFLSSLSTPMSGEIAERWAANLPRMCQAEEALCSYQKACLLDESDSSSCYSCRESWSMLDSGSDYWDVMCDEETSDNVVDDGFSNPCGFSAVELTLFLEESYEVTPPELIIVADEQQSELGSITDVAALPDNSVVSRDEGELSRDSVAQLPVFSSTPVVIESVKSEGLRRFTRSQGTVIEYPNVQPSILEYQRVK